MHQALPSAPMALEQHRFKEKGNEKMPFKPEYPAVREIPRCVKVILNSADRISGSTLTQPKWKVNLPTEFIGKKMNLVVDSLIIANSPNSQPNLSLFPYYLRFTDYRSPLSFSSNTGTTSGMILLTSGLTYHNNSPRDTGGVAIVDPNIFDRLLSLEFWSPHMDMATSLLNAYSIQLSLYDAGE